MLPQDCLANLNHAGCRTSPMPGSIASSNCWKKEVRFLIHGSFSRAMPIGCLATHIAWHHPATEQTTLSRRAMAQPRGRAQSGQLTGHSRMGSGQECNWEVRQDLLGVFKEHREVRRQNKSEPRSRVLQEV